MLLGTRQVAGILQLSPSRIMRAIWEGRIQSPVKGPGGAFIWNEVDIRRTAWALLRRDLKEEELDAIQGESRQ